MGSKLRDVLFRKGFRCDILSFTEVKDRVNRKQTAIESVQLTRAITIIFSSNQQLVCLPLELMPPLLENKMMDEEVHFLYNTCSIGIIATCEALQ